MPNGSRPRVGLIVSTYNNPINLRATLRSIRTQSLRPDGVYVADDGSGGATREVVAIEARDLPLKHIWHEDIGFRLSAIRNRAIAAAREEYLVFVDGDTVLHRHFVRDHATLARIGAALLPGRCAIRGFHDTGLDEAPTPVGLLRLFAAKRILNDNIRHGTSFRAQAKGLVKGLRSPIPIVRRCTPKETRGGNMSMWRRDLLSVNGFDEQFKGWGYEDIDCLDRLRRKGVTLLQVIGACVCFHLDHPIRDENGANRLRLSVLREIECGKGVRQYLSDPIHNLGEPA
jgi:glycosyltransferase involved in cell wall biosynthesis